MLINSWFIHSFIQSDWRVFYQLFGCLKDNDVAERALVALVQHGHSGWDRRMRPEIIHVRSDDTCLPTSTLFWEYVERWARIRRRPEEDIGVSDAMWIILSKVLDLYIVTDNDFIRQKS